MVNVRLVWRTLGAVVVLAAGCVGAAPLGSTVSAAPSNATVVATNGSDSNPGTASAPKRTIAAAVASTPHGGTIAVRRGVYHESVQIYAKALTIQPWKNEEVWLDGSTRITAWTQIGNFWRTSWRSPFPVTTTSNGIIDPSNPAAGHIEMVFRDGTPQTQVLSSSQLAAGRFYVDRTNGYLWIGSSPLRIDVSDLPWALYFNHAHDSKLVGLGVRRYSTPPANMAAVRAYGDRILIDDVFIKDTALTALSAIGNGVTIQDTTISAAGFIGIHGNNADNLTLERTLVQRANTFGFNSGHSASGMKVTRSRHLHIRNNLFTDNDGPGIWTDQDSWDVNVYRNFVSGSGDEGIEIELSANVVIAGNTVVDSANMGIKLLDTNDAQVWNNTLARNRTHIETFDGYRDANDTSSSDHDFRFPVPQPGMTWNTHDITIRNNVMHDGTGFAFLNTDDIEHTSNATQDRISADYDVYTRQVPTQPQHIGRWAAYPEAAKTGTTVPIFRANSGQETHGVGYDVSVPNTFPLGTTLPSEVAALLGVAASPVRRGAL